MGLPRRGAECRAFPRAVLQRGVLTRRAGCGRGRRLRIALSLGERGGGGAVDRGWGDVECEGEGDERAAERGAVRGRAERVGGGGERVRGADHERGDELDACGAGDGERLERGGREGERGVGGGGQ